MCFQLVKPLTSWSLDLPGQKKVLRASKLKTTAVLDSASLLQCQNMFTKRAANCLLVIFLYIMGSVQKISIFCTHTIFQLYIGKVVRLFAIARPCSCVVVIEGKCQQMCILFMVVYFLIMCVSDYILCETLK